MTRDKKSPNRWRVSEPELMKQTVHSTQ